MKGKKLISLRLLIMLLQGRNRKTNNEKVIEENTKLIEALSKHYSKISKSLIEFLYTYLYNSSANADTQYIKYNDKSNEFVIFTAYPSKDNSQEYDYEKISLSKDPEIPINKEKIHIESNSKSNEASIQRSVSILLPENIELVKLESKKRIVKKSNVTQMINFGRKLPLDSVQFRNLSDISIIMVASAAEPFHNTASFYVQDPTEIEKIVPHREIKHSDIKLESNEYWNYIPTIIKKKDMPYYTKEFLTEMVKYQSDKRKRKLKKFPESENSENSGTQIALIDDAVMDFVNNYRNKITIVDGEALDFDLGIDHRRHQ